MIPHQNVILKLAILTISLNPASLTSEAVKGKLISVAAHNNESEYSVRLNRNTDPCNCTSFFQCDLSAVIQPHKETVEPEESDEETGANLEVIDIRLKTPVQSPCKHYLEICCNQYQQKTKPKTVQPQENQGMQSSLHCGKRNANGVGFRIVGNVEGEAQLGEFTWMIAVTELRSDKQSTIYVCGGSLIHPRIVLTAAHCVQNKSPQNLRVRAGEWDTQTENEDPYIHHDRQVDKIILHEDYTTRPVLKNDIALILLSKAVPLARHIGTVCLSSDLQPMEGQRCFASGWGKNLWGKEGGFQSILKKVDLPIVSRRTCQSTLRETRLGSKFRLHNSFVCAGGERGKDTCKGDGGSPLVCQMPNSDRYAQHGIVSWGLNCGEPIPGVYVNVPLFVPWIEEKIIEMGLDSSYFKAR